MLILLMFLIRYQNFCKGYKKGMNKDFKHVVKFYRTTLLSSKAINITLLNEFSFYLNRFPLTLLKYKCFNKLLV